jgi:hypothetical protein
MEKIRNLKKPPSERDQRPALPASAFFLFMDTKALAAATLILSG